MALKFGGSGNYLNNGTPPVLGDVDRTIELWVRWDAWSNSGTSSTAKNTVWTLGTAADWSMFLATSAINSGVPRVMVDSGGVDITTNCTTTIVLGVWYHIAVVFQDNGGPANLYVYVNGVLEGNTNNIGALRNGSNIRIATGPTATSNGEHGLITVDEMRVWNLALSQERIKANMHRRIASAPDLVAYYRFDESAVGAITPDYTQTRNLDVFGTPTVDSGAPIQATTA